MIVNAYDQLKAAGGGVVISWHANGGRSVLPRTWVVSRYGPNGRRIPTDPAAQAWYVHGDKWFMPHGGGREAKAAAFAEAVAWIAAQGWYTGEWKRNSIGEYVPAHINKQFPTRRSES